MTLLTFPITAALPEVASDENFGVDNGLAFLQAALDRSKSVLKNH